MAATNDTFVMKFNGAQFRCGTSELLKTQAEQAGLSNPANFKEISFLCSKQTLLVLFDKLAENSLTVTSFDKEKLEAVVMPKRNDSMWISIPTVNNVFIKRNLPDSFPAKIIYTINDYKTLKVEIAADSSIIYQLKEIVSRQGLSIIH